MATLTPTVGRRVYFYSTSSPFAGNTCQDERQAFDAGILYVHPDGRVNLLVTAHNGQQAFVERAELRNPQDGDKHGVDTYATWMPYQVAAAGVAPVPEPVPTPAPLSPV